MIRVDQSKCIGCGICTKDCLQEILHVTDGKLQSPTTDCLNCGHCVAICPASAISIPDYDMADIETISGHDTLDPNVLLTAIKSRRSIRHFKDTPVAMELIDKIVEAARYSPTGSNRQEVEFILVQDRIPELTRTALSVLAKLPEDPPANLPRYFIDRYKERWPEMERMYLEDGKDPLFYHANSVLIFTGTSAIDAALAASNASLMAHALGLGCVHIGFMEIAGKTKCIQDFFHLEPGRKLVCCLAIGHPDVHYVRTAPRKAKSIQRM